jgi:hypothetical protein
VQPAAIAAQAGRAATRARNSLDNRKARRCMEHLRSATHTDVATGAARTRLNAMRSRP